MKIKTTQLYGFLNFYRKMDNLFRDPFDIYFYLYGYYHGQINKSIPDDEQEQWLHYFFDFIRIRLEEIYSPKEFNLRYNHFGEMINLLEPNEKRGIEMFYILLDEFVDKHDQNEFVKENPLI